MKKWNTRPTSASDAEKERKFMDLLDNPAPPNDALKNLLNGSSRPALDPKLVERAEQVKAVSHSGKKGVELCTKISTISSVAAMTFLFCGIPEMGTEQVFILECMKYQKSF